MTLQNEAIKAFYFKIIGKKLCNVRFPIIKEQNFIMKSIVSLLISLAVSFCSYSQDYVSSLEFSRTFNIKKDSSTATCFLIETNQKNYWVTAKHVFPNSKNKQRVSFFILQDTSWLLGTGTLLIHSNPQIDIAIISPDDTSTTNAIKLDQGEIVLGDEGFFLGFPFGLKTTDKSKINKGFPIPLVKKCVFSGGYSENGVQMYFLDGNNNPGFSGGPVFFKKRDKTNDNRLYLAAVVSAYVNQKNQMITPIGVLDYTENSGIILAFSATHIEEILSQNGK